MVPACSANWPQIQTNHGVSYPYVGLARQPQVADRVTDKSTLCDRRSVWQATNQQGLAGKNTRNDRVS
jgi:hypothetical protein